MFKKLFLILSLSLISVSARSDTPRYWKLIYESKEDQIKIFGEFGSFEPITSGTNMWQFRVKSYIVVSSGTAEKVGTQQCKLLEDGVITRDINSVYYSERNGYTKARDEEWQFYKPNQIAYSLCMAGLDLVEKK